MTDEVRAGEEPELAIVVKLTMPFTRIPGTGERLINPHGPKAAEIIKELVEVLRDTKNFEDEGEGDWDGDIAPRIAAILTRAGVKQ